MSERGRPMAISLSISAVERDTGLSKDTLRVWERRYGFPVPARDGAGERAYPLDQVERLRIIKRLLDAGHRPGRIVPLAFDDLRQIAASTVDQPQRSAAAALVPDGLQRHLELVRRHDLPALQAALAALLARVGTDRFVHDVAAPLTTAVGDAWMRGRLEIFEEHGYTETMQAVLRQAIAAIPEPPDGPGPRVLLTTFPGEPHGLGLLMTQALLRLEGCPCVSLGVETPPWDIVLAASAHRADIVGLSFTACANPNQVVDGLADLRAKLPAATSLWVGGSAPALHRRRLPGVQAFEHLRDLPEALHRWRQASAGQPS